MGRFAAEAADRDDLFQEILIALWDALPRFHAQARLSTYVYRVAHNCALNWKRSQRRYHLKTEAFALAAAGPTASSAHDQDRLRWLYARIHELPPVDRTVILLSLDRLNYADIAEITGLSQSNVGVRLHRIKHQLATASKTFRHEL